MPLHEAALPMNATPLHSESRLWQTLAARREAIAAQWTALACAVYPLGAAGFLRTNPDPFANPVGQRTKEVAEIFSRIVSTPTPTAQEEAELARAVEELIRVRAVQAISPQDAVGVFLDMKRVVRAELSKASGSSPNESLEAPPKGTHETLTAPSLEDSLFVLDARIDAMTLAAFGVYCECRERLAAMKVAEHKRRYAQILRLAQRHAPGEVEELMQETDQ